MRARPAPAPSFPHVSTPPDRAVWWLVQTVSDAKPHLVLSQSAFGAAAARKLSMTECVRLERALDARAAALAVALNASHGAGLA
jgi:hypothetical protein